MTDTCRFRMKVDASFSFRDGRTVFVGAVEEHVRFIGAGTCYLVRKGERLLTLKIEGEMFPHPRPAPPARMVSTTDPIPSEITNDLLGLELICED